MKYTSDKIFNTIFEKIPCIILSSKFLLITLTAINGGWSGWSGWSGCSAGCGGGSMTHYRSCTNPAPAWGGLGCQGPSSESTSCNTQGCGMFSSLNFKAFLELCLYVK